VRDDLRWKAVAVVRVSFFHPATLVHPVPARQPPLT
jgi:hypothetical protein